MTRTAKIVFGVWLIVGIASLILVNVMHIRVGFEEVAVTPAAPGGPGDLLFGHLIVAVFAALVFSAPATLAAGLTWLTLRLFGDRNEPPN